MLSMMLLSQRPAMVQPEQQILPILTNASAKLYGHPKAERAWKYSSTGSRKSLNNGVCDVYMSLQEPKRISSIHALGLSERMRNGPQQSEKFKTLSEWEQFGFTQIHKIWQDVDGFVVRTSKTGETFDTGGGKKMWDSDSNTMRFTWFTVPVQGKLRQFDCSMDLATGKVLHMACTGFMKAGRYKVVLDNSKKRKTKAALPSN